MSDTDQIFSRLTPKQSTYRHGLRAIGFNGLTEDHIIQLYDLAVLIQSRGDDVTMGELLSMDNKPFEEKKLIYDSDYEIANFGFIDNHTMGVIAETLRESTGNVQRNIKIADIKHIPLSKFRLQNGCGGATITKIIMLFDKIRGHE